MEIKYIGKNVEFTMGMKEYTANKLERLEKYFVIDENTEVRVLARTYPHHVQKVEITIPTKFGVLRSEKATSSYYTSVDMAMDSLEDQIRRMKTRLIDRHKGSLAKTFADEDAAKPSDLVYKEKQIVLEEIDVDEAIMRMSLSGHDSFYMFKDAASGRPAIVYARRAGGYGVIYGA